MTNPDTLPDAIEAELTHVLMKQGEKSRQEAVDLSKLWRSRLITGDLTRPALSPRDFLHFWTAWAFVRRNTETDTNFDL